MTQPREGARVRSALRRLSSAARRRGPRKDASASPASYDEYLRRESSREAGFREAGFPAAWASGTDVPIDSPSRFAAVAHVYYPELWEELLGHLGAIPVDLDLIVTNASGTPLVIDVGRLPSARHALVLDVENRGRDLWPLAQLANAGLLDSYDVVIKVHTKRSPWRGAHGRLAGTGESWRSELLSALLGDAENVAAIVEAFTESADLGMVTADDSVLGPEFWGDDEAVAATLLRRLEREPDRDSLAFAAGSMYWARGAILRRLRALHLTAADFEPEQGQVDGTTAHALERVIGLFAREAGLRVVERSELPAAARGPAAR